MKVNEILEGFVHVDERKRRKKPSKSRCLSPGGPLSAFDHAHCVNMGYSPRKTHHTYRDVDGRVKDPYGKKVKGAGSGGPIPDYTKASRARGGKKN